MEAWVGTLLTGLLGGGGLAAVLVFIATRKRDKQSGITERFDDASQLAQYIREEVERQVAPIRERLQTVEAESTEIQNAFREWIFSVWRWNTRGRVGEIPMPPPQILHRLEIGYLAEDDWHTEPPIYKEKHT